MAAVWLTVSNKVQDLKIDSNECTTSYDGLRAVLRLILRATLRVPGKGLGFEILSAKAILRLKNGMRLSETVFPIGWSIKDPHSDWDPGIMIEFILDDKAINAIESSRKGDIDFDLDITMVIVEKSAIKLSNGVVIWNIDDSKRSDARLEFTIHQSKWAEKHLPQLGHPGFKLFEIPLFHNQLEEAYDDIILNFNKAEKYLLKQDYNMAVGHCRLTLDALTRNLKKIKDGVESETNFKWLSTIDKATLSWIDEQNKCITAVSSKPHHSGMKRDFTRKEAQSIYLSTLALMNFISDVND